MSKESNLVYGVPWLVVAAGSNKNLVQASMPAKKDKHIEDFERILNFTKFANEKEDKTNIDTSSNNENVVSATNLNNKNLYRLLKFGSG